MLLAMLLAAAEAPKPFTEKNKTEISVFVGRQLSDPYSAQYEWPEVRDDGVYCGWVNAKNRFGAYSGYRQFLILYGFSNKDGHLLNSSTADLDPEVVSVMCRRYGYRLSRD